MPFRPASTDGIRLSDNVARVLLEELIRDLSDPIRGEAFAGEPGAAGQDRLGLEHGAADRFRILRRLAHGGMGVVYEAEQSNPRRTVALKVIRAERVSEELLRRFRREAETLARLHHPCIAQIYDAGAMETPSGRQPYLAMEMIRGEPITGFADRLGLTARDRIGLLLRVCDAADHMHEAGVVHRDLKPDNILVDGRGEPRIIDFGVVLLRDSDPTVARTTMNTEFGRLLGTLPYMSPEQVSGDPVDIDERADVYALGVMLFEMLAGRLPYELDRRMLEASLRTIREEEPARLGSVDRALRGDLETIVAKALEKDPARRYRSATEFAADLRRYLENQPVEARRPSAFYRARKFVRRHRRLVAASSLLFLVLAAASVVTSIQAVEATRQAERATAVKDFLKSMLLAPDPTRDGRDVRVVDALDRAEAMVANRFEEHPHVEADVREMMGSVYHGLGLYEAAREQFESSLALLRTQRAENDPVVINSLHNYAIILSELGRHEEAAPLMRTVIDRFTSELGPADPTTMASRSMLGLILLRNSETAEAEAVLRRVLALQRENLGGGHPDTVNTMNTWAGVLSEMGRTQEAIDARTEHIDLLTAEFGEEHPMTLGSRFNLARLRQRQGDHEAALKTYKDLLPRNHRTFGPRHPRSLMVISSRAQALAELERFDEAIRAFQRALEAHREVFGEAHPETIEVALERAATLDDAGHREEALRAVEAALANAQDLEADEPSILAEVRLEYGALLTSLGRHDEAEGQLQRAHASYLSIYGETHERTKLAAEALADWKDRAEATAQ